MGKDWSCWTNFKGTLKQLYLLNLKKKSRFFGRRKGRKLSKSAKLVLREGEKYFIQKS